MHPNGLKYRRGMPCEAELVITAADFQFELSQHRRPHIFGWTGAKTNGADSSPAPFTPCKRR
jgi:hypothetical protein